MVTAADLPVDILEDIFLRLDDTADLVRASAACAAFRRVVTDGRFLRRFRSLHRRPVLGLLSHRSRASGGGGELRFHPAAPPRRSAQAARAVARTAASFFSFLPADDPTTTEHGWRVHDARDGRVLLSPGGAGDDDEDDLPSFPYLVVYDPLHHKHVKIPPIPTDIVGCTCLLQGCSCDYNCSCNCECDCEFDPFLVPAASADADEDDFSFRVVCTVLSTDMECDFVLEAFVYSSATGEWRGVASLSEADYPDLYYELSLMQRHYAHGCFYWVASCTKHMLVLDMKKKKKFGFVRLPPGIKRDEDKIIVVKAAATAAEDNRIGLLVLCGNNTLDLYTKPAFGAASSDYRQWRHDAAVTLPDDSYQWFFVGAADQGYVLLQRFPQDEYAAWRHSHEELRQKINAQYFTVELQTLVVEQLCVTEFDPEEPAFLYVSFPPPFAPPSV